MITTGIGNLNFKDLKFMMYPYSDLPEIYFHLFLVQGCNDLLANGSKTTGIYQLQVLISTTFYELFVKAFKYSKVCIYIPWQKEKTAHRMSLKQTSTVNFINVLRANFLYKHCFNSFSTYM